MELMGSATWPVQPRGYAVEASGSEQDTIKAQKVVGAFVSNAKAKLVVAAAVSAAL